MRREKISIHPTLAYGIHTTLDKAIYLRASVTLKEISDAPKKEFPILTPLDLSLLQDSGFEEECQRKYDLLAKYKGWHLRNHFSKFSHINSR